MVGSLYKKNLVKPFLIYSILGESASCGRGRGAISSDRQRDPLLAVFLRDNPNGRGMNRSTPRDRIRCLAVETGPVTNVNFQDEMLP